jgi:hypothetical protein
MPVLYGHPEKSERTMSSYVEQYAKWFDMHGMDFEAINRSGVWVVSAWSRGMASSLDDVPWGQSGQCDSLNEALLYCYMDTKEWMRKYRGTTSPVA